MGFGSGPYLVLPLLGPSSIRDKASKFLRLERTLQAIELDPYIFTRNTYLARRCSAVDGEDPLEQDAHPAHD